MRIAEIQGLRALAVLLVIAFHAKFLPGGFIGVDIFYVISGYLITGLLVRELDETGSISFRNFYSRRIKRLLPSSFFVLFSTAVIGFMLMPANMRADLGRNIMATALYVGNYLFAWWQNDYQNLGATPSPVIHYWSLAVEEQFYLIWPLLILLAGRRGRSHRVFQVVLAVTAFSFLLSLIATHFWPIWSFYSLPTRAWELGIGALVVLWKREGPRYSWLAAISLAALVFATFKFNESTPFPGWAALLPTLATGQLLLMIHDLPHFLSYLLRTRFAQWVGAISYPLYLWHWPALVLPMYLLQRPLSALDRLFFIALTFILSGFTYYVIENPLRHLKTSLRIVFSTAVIATLFSVLFGIGIAASSSQKLTVTAGSAPISLKEITREPAIYAQGCQLGKTATQSPPCEYGDVHSAKTIVLFGDSHAAQWFPTLNAISISKGFKLVVLTKSSCPSLSVNLPDQGAFRNGPCKQWRENSLLRIQKIHPWAVFVTSYDHYQAPIKTSSLAQWWIQGYETTMSRLQNATSHRIYLADTPWPSKDIPSCLTKNQASHCLTARPTSIIKPSLNKGVLFIDPTNWFCTQVCPAIINQTVVYRDASHMSVDFALHLVPNLTKVLTSSGLIPR
jgi:peptidoglycan/LPS O-acetylase OafA/YrhL